MAFLFHSFQQLVLSWNGRKDPGTPTSLCFCSISSRLGPSWRGCWAESSSVSPSLPGHASRHSEGPYRDPVLRLATLATLPSSSQSYKACEVGIISDLEFSHLLSSSWPTRKVCSGSPPASKANTAVAFTSKGWKLPSPGKQNPISINTSQLHK